MQSRSPLHVLFALLSLILSKVQDVIGSDPYCVKLSSADNGMTRITFLREDAAGVRSLYLSLWSEELRLVSCERNTGTVITEEYHALCGRSSTHQDLDITHRFNTSALLAPDAPCALVSSSAPNFTKRVKRDGTEVKTRRKRSWIFPGTLWCGAGTRAREYGQLGMFENADRCCREHDHCPHIIPAFTLNYGVFNSKFHTVSHCDCDRRFRRCLMGVNDTISRMVGYSFFSMLQIPCFELKQQKRCTEMYWCKKAGKAPLAVMRNPLPYNSTDVAGKHIDTADSDTSSPNTTAPKRKEHRCSSKDSHRGDTLPQRRRKGKGCKKHRRLDKVAPSQIPSVLGANSTTPSTDNSSAEKNSTRKPTHSHQPPPQMTTKSQETSTTRRPALPTAVTESHKKVTEQRPCCGFKIPLRGDTFQPHCKSCQKTTSHTPTATPSMTTSGLPIKATTHTTPKHNTWSTATPPTPATTKLKREASIHAAGTPQEQMGSHLPWNNTSQEPVATTKAPNRPAERGRKLNPALHNLTDNQLLCESLKLLDGCKYKIPPLEKKYDLHNMDSKMAYHCDCTSRLAAQIESSKQPSTLPKLLMDFVSQSCFKLPKKKECRSRKSCSGGFSKASDLLQALKKIEEKGTAGVRNSGNGRKRGIPVRLYKRCLRLEREADIMAQLT